MSVCSCVLEKEYEKLRAKVMTRAAKYGFIRVDSEDILHDCCVEILENGIINPEDYSEVVSRIIGKHRTYRSRRLF